MFRFTLKFDDPLHSMDAEHGVPLPLLSDALAALRLSYLDEAESGKKEAHTGRPELALLVAACLIAAVLSVFLTDAGDAMFAFFLLFAAPIVHRFAR